MRVANGNNIVIGDPFNRREMCARLLAGAGILAFRGRPRGAAPSKRCTLSIGTYSLKGPKLEDSIKLVADLGYDGIEIATQPGFSGEPAQLSAAQRTDLRSHLEGSGLKLTALMEQLPPSPDDSRHKAGLARLRAVMELGHELAPQSPPLLQTVLGGGSWNNLKEMFRERIADWLALAREMKTVLAIKPHRGGGMSRPEEAIWLIRQLGDSPWLRMVYDYSHYAFRGMSLESMVKESLPYIAHVAVKDAVQQGDRVVFALPGESGTISYPLLLRLLYDGGYRGDICCEVSSMVSGKTGYDSAAAAKICYRNLSRAFVEAGVRRR